MKRSELYAKVWAQPMAQLAAELGISDVGLTKACRRACVPTPELDLRVDFATIDPQD